MIDQSFVSEVRKAIWQDLERLPSGLAAGNLCSEYSAANFFLFRQTYQFEPILEGGLIARGILRDGRKFALPLPTISMGFFEPWSFGQPTTSLIYPFSPLVAISDQIRKSMITMREHADYVYDQTTFADMQSTGLKRQSQGIRAIFRNHRVNLRSTRVGDVELIDNWLDKKKIVLGDADSQEFIEAVESLMALGLSGITAELDGAVAGVIVFEPQMSGNVIVLFAKTDHQYPYLLSLLYNHLAKEIPVGTSINLCQDLGLPGLRQKKLSMKPARLLTKSSLLMPWE